MALTFRTGLLAGALAGASLFTVPAAAATLPSAPERLGLSPAAFGAGLPSSPQDSVAAWGCRWNCGWGHRRGWRRDRVDAGDVLIGAAVIGGIAAIISSNNRRQRDREVVVIERDRDFRDPRYRDAPYRDDRRAPSRAVGASGLDSAVNMCLDRIERDVRVDRVDDARRTASGWQVSGSLFNGAGFQCNIGNDGQIDTIDYGDGFAANGVPGAADTQWNDQTYADARARVGGSVRPDLAVNEVSVEGGQIAPLTPRTATTASAMPAYPGGPVPGEEIPETLEDIGG